MRFCPSCKKEAPKRICPDCLTDMVDDLDSRQTCPLCGVESPSWVTACRSCLAVLDSEVNEEALLSASSKGLRLIRPAGVAPFREGANCTVTRFSPNGGLIYTGADGLVEALIDSADHAAHAPLHCRDVAGALMFTLQRYAPAPNGVEVVDANGTPLGNFRGQTEGTKPTIAIRDEAGAPIGKLFPSMSLDRSYELIETGGGSMGHLTMHDTVSEWFIDDSWTFRQTAARLPIKGLMAIAIPLAAKVLLGRSKPQSRQPDQSTDE